jgi:hypothetical protein
MPVRVTVSSAALTCQPAPKYGLGSEQPAARTDGGTAQVAPANIATDAQAITAQHKRRSRSGQVRNRPINPPRGSSIRRHTTTRMPEIIRRPPDLEGWKIPLNQHAARNKQEDRAACCS